MKTKKPKFVLPEKPFDDLTWNLICYARRCAGSEMGAYFYFYENNKNKCDLQAAIDSYEINLTLVNHAKASIIEIMGREDTE